MISFGGSTDSSGPCNKHVLGYWNPGVVSEHTCFHANTGLSPVHRSLYPSTCIFQMSIVFSSGVTVKNE